MGTCGAVLQAVVTVAIENASLLQNFALVFAPSESLREKISALDLQS
jgi:hypothetical protein